MLKYLVGFALVFGLAVYVSVQDEHTTQQPATKTTQPDKNAVPAKADENHPQQNVPYPERHTPSWYSFFRWPNGTTAWAILLTLLAIAEQTKETATSARAALLNAQAVINAERPWVMIQIKETMVDKGERESVGIFSPRWFQLTIFNYGKTPAHIIACKGPKIEFHGAPDKDLPIPPDYGIGGVG